MDPRNLSPAVLPLAILALCGSLSVAQTSTAPAPATPDAPATAQAPPAPPAPIERHPRETRPPRLPQPAMGPMMREHGMGSFRTGPMGFGMERKWWKDTNVAQQLNLTPDQVKKMDGIFEQSKLQLIDLRANVEKQEVLLEPLLSANPVETAKASAQIEKVARARADLEVASAKMLLGIRGVLTPDQWTKLNDRRSWRRGFDGGPAGAPSPAPAPPAGGGPGRHGGQPGPTFAPLPDDL